MFKNKKIFFYFVFLLNIIFFIKSADMETEEYIFGGLKDINDGILDPKITMDISLVEPTPMDVDTDNGSDNMVADDWAYYNKLLSNDQQSMSPSFPYDSEILDIPTLDVLIDKTSKGSKLIDKETERLDQLIKKAINGSELIEEEEKLLKTFWKKTNSRLYHNLLFEQIPGTEHFVYKFKNGEGIISVIFNNKKNGFVCDCGAVVEYDAIGLHMLNHSVFKKTIGCKECPECKKKGKIPFYVHPDYIQKHNNQCHNKKKK